MSRSTDIFADTPQSLADFKRTLESIIGKKLHCKKNDEEVWYEYNDDHVILTVGEHEFVNDRDMLFENYRYHIGIRAIGARNEDDRIAGRDSLVNQLFEQLKAKQRYRLLLVEDVQVKREEYQPATSTAP